MKDGKIIYLDGKVLVNDFKKDSKNTVELKEYEYQDNIKEIIKQENIIEELENEKNKTNNKILNNYTTINTHEHAISWLKIMWVTIPLFAAFMGFLLSFGNSIQPLFGIKQHWLSLGILGTVITSAGLSGPFALFKYILKTAYKDNNGNKLQLKELEKELVKNKKILNQLQNNKLKENEQEAMIKKTDDIHNIHLDEYRKIRNELLLYREIGENMDKFSKYYTEDTLEENLNEFYNSEEIEKIKTYFKSQK